MKRLCIIIGFIAAILSVILSVTPLFKIAIFPIVVSILCGLAIFFLSKKDQSKSKSIQYIGLLIIISLAFVVYKAIFTTTEVANVEELEQQQDESKEDAIELLEGIEIDE